MDSHIKLAALVTSVFDTSETATWPNSNSNTNSDPNTNNNRNTNSDPNTYLEPFSDSGLKLISCQQKYLLRLGQKLIVDNKMLGQDKVLGNIFD